MIYLDHHATTPVDARVLEAMLPFFTEKFGNAASKQHQYGWDAQDAVDRARKQLASLIGAGTKDIVFTSGATEANNLAIKGAAAARRGERNHLVTVVTEHRAVLDPMASLERDGWQVTALPVASSGLVDLVALSEAVTERTAVVSVMAANNEIGVLQPIKEAAAIAHAKGAWFHTDAVQAVGKIPFDVAGLDVDLASMTAHKIYGPKGVGALYVNRRRVTLAPQLDGGGHERGLRSGTLNVPGIVGFGRAAEICRLEMAGESARIRDLRDRLLTRLRESVPGITVNGTMVERLPGNLNVSFDDVDGEALLVSLDDVAVSSGAACTQAEPSHVLMALGRTKDRALASLRFGIGRGTTAGDVDYAAAKVHDVVSRLRHLSPVH
ncbi:MAG TPA: aminotransferase class V-fold PLP-dependent enzyme [Vicinamibacterales bacterium]|nr:aminotransferase class V-fold PLP-dependent enzyme [Vicinamibacterales bacterium]